LLHLSAQWKKEGRLSGVSPTQPLPVLPRVSSLVFILLLTGKTLDCPYERGRLGILQQLFSIVISDKNDRKNKPCDFEIE
jgi:hypothetical protein